MKAPGLFYSKKQALSCVFGEKHSAEWEMRDGIENCIK